MKLIRENNTEKDQLQESTQVCLISIFSHLRTQSRNHCVCMSSWAGSWWSLPTWRALSLTTPRWPRVTGQTRVHGPGLEMESRQWLAMIKKWDFRLKLHCYNPVVLKWGHFCPLEMSWLYMGTFLIVNLERRVLLASSGQRPDAAEHSPYSIQTFPPSTTRIIS